jgi:hypothetical protein
LILVLMPVAAVLLTAFVAFTAGVKVGAGMRLPRRRRRPF